MLDKIKRALSNQFHIDNLELQYESPNDFLSGFLGILIIENNILI